MIIEWRDINSVNVQELDEQHKKLVAIINRFFGIKPEDQAGMLAIVKELAAYAEFHFQTEEGYFAKFGYEKIQEHLKQHQFYREQIASFQQRLVSGEDRYQLVADSLEFLREWWVGHINGADQDYSACFNQHGLY